MASKNFSVSTSGSKVTGTLTDKLPCNPVTLGTQGLQAIGPRVTFNFITDPWSSDNTYSYYDVVKNGGNTYIARKYVPENIDISNTDYWVLWAEPNAQYQELYDIVITYDDRIKKVEDLSTELKSEMEDLSTELKSEMEDLSTELKSEMEDLSTELKLEITVAINGIETSFEEFQKKISNKLVTYPGMFNGNVHMYPFGDFYNYYSSVGTYQSCCYNNGKFYIFGNTNDEYQHLAVADKNLDTCTLYENKYNLESTHANSATYNPYDECIYLMGYKVIYKISTTDYNIIETITLPKSFTGICTYDGITWYGGNHNSDGIVITIMDNEFNILDEHTFGEFFYGVSVSQDLQMISEDILGFSFTNAIVWIDVSNMQILGTSNIDGYGEVEDLIIDENKNIFILCNYGNGFTIWKSNIGNSVSTLHYGDNLHIKEFQDNSVTEWLCLNPYSTSSYVSKQGFVHNSLALENYLYLFKTLIDVRIYSKELHVGLIHNCNVSFNIDSDTIGQNYADVTFKGIFQCSLTFSNCHISVPKDRSTVNVTTSRIRFAGCTDTNSGVIIYSDDPENKYYDFNGCIIWFYTSQSNVDMLTYLSGARIDTRNICFSHYGIPIITTNDTTRSFAEILDDDRFVAVYNNLIVRGALTVEGIVHSTEDNASSYYGGIGRRCFWHTGTFYDKTYETNSAGSNSYEVEAFWNVNYLYKCTLDNNPAYISLYIRSPKF